MGRLAKRLLKTCGRPALVLLRPFLRRLDAYLNRHIAQLAMQMEVWHGQHMQALREFDLLGDSLVREMARLQLQLSLLEESLREAVPHQDPQDDQAAGTLPASRRPPSQAA
ncbi:MAG TPA: hypothetical protein VHC19_03055 [Pirellulales bacterium]|nr:hypothetical protein [Pirellulales bacterium]